MKTGKDDILMFIQYKNLKYQKRVIFSGLTGAKKILIVGWKPLHSSYIKQWVSSFHNLLVLEMPILLL